jgi:ATP-dependent Zn protease
MPTKASKKSMTAADQGFSETDLACASLLQLVIGAAVIADPESRTSMDRIMVGLRKDYLAAGKKTSAAVIEGVRLRSTAAKSQPAELMRQKRVNP